MCNSTKRVTCPNSKCGVKNEIKIGRDNGDSWETKEIICWNCRHPIKYQVNNHGNKIKVINSRPLRTRSRAFH
ncbi:MAG: hypothetical protein PHE52_00545 [Candidatus Pacebacteria bacterium]|nr:hypothetical protein [Candidatus Paceibacterota bacterium]